MLWSLKRWESWRCEMAHAREVYATLDLDGRDPVHGEPTEIRDILVHLVEEYARHVGHADLLRECIDGRAGHLPHPGRLRLTQVAEPDESRAGARRVGRPGTTRS